MGCASSKQSKCRHCKTTKYSPLSRRSYSMNVHHPPEKQGDSYHMVALTSSTLGSIRLEKPVPISFSADAERWDDRHYERKEIDVRRNNHEVGIEKNKDFTMGMIEAKNWSKMIDEKITRVAPKTPIRTPPGEPETINVQELMDGLESNYTSPLRGLGEKHARSFSFHVSLDSLPSLIDSPRKGGGGFQEDRLESPKNTKAWFDAQEKDDNVNSISKALVSEFDPEVISMFRKALEELSPTNPFHLKARDGARDQQQQVIKDDLGVLQDNDKSNEEDRMMNGYLNDEKLLNEFVDDGDGDGDGYAHVNGFVDRMIADEKDDSAEEKDDVSDLQDYGNDHINEDDIGDVVINSKKERVILYFTSLRGVRGTYENCCYVRLILKGLGVRVDERDVSMHSGFKEELKELLGEGFKGSLPKVFIGERYIGGIEEIQKMHEDGKLEKLVAHCERLEDDGGNLLDVCEACGDIRFVPCETCSGSCKIYYEHEEGDDEYEEEEYGFQRCPDCNENGLIRCPVCCY